MKRALFVLLISLTLQSCAITKNVVPVSTPITKGSDICIELNQAVAEGDILSVLESGIGRNGLKPVVYRVIPSECKYSLAYTARQKWDFTRFLSYAKIRLFDSNVLIGSVEYRLPSGVFGSGGVNPEKFDSTEQKIGPLIDQLFN